MNVKNIQTEGRNRESAEFLLIPQKKIKFRQRQKRKEKKIKEAGKRKESEDFNV